MSSVSKVQEIIALGDICFIKVKASRKKEREKTGQFSDFEYLMVCCWNLLVTQESTQLRTGKKTYAVAWFFK